MSTIASHYGSLTALTWSTTSVSTIVLVLRLFTRIRLRTVGAEDHLMTLAWCCTLATACIFQYSLSLAISTTPTTSVEDSSPEPLHRFSTAEAILLFFCGLLAKASVALLLLRLLGKTLRSVRIIIITSLIIYAASTLLAIVAGIIPPCDQTFSVQASLPNGTCISNGIAWLAFVQTWNFASAALDILYSLLASYIIYQLQVTRKKKAGLIAVLSLGWITAVLAIWRSIGAWVYTFEQKQEFNVVAIALEANLVIICASLPTLGPLFEYLRTGKSLSPRGSAESVEARRAEAAQGVMGLRVGVRGHARQRSREELLSPVEREAARQGSKMEGSVVEMQKVVSR